MSVFSVTDFFRIVALLERHLNRPSSYQVEVLSADGRNVRSASGHAIVPDGAVAHAGDYALIVIPPVEGARLGGGVAPDSTLVSWLAARKQEGARLLALTTGAAYVAATGLADNVLMATHWAFVRQLKKRYPNCQFVAHPSFLQADGIWTTGSLGGGFDALLEAVAQDEGDPFAQMCAAHLLIAPPEKLSPILPGTRNHFDAAILKVQEWMESRHAQAITITQMGREVGMADRTLKRRFQLATGLSPNRYLQKLRVEKAKKLLLATDQSIKAVAYGVGYENVSFFVRVFKTQTGLTPAQWRKGADEAVRKSR